MGLVDRIERRLEVSVGDAFARVFGGSIVPQEVETLLQREAEAGARTVGGGRVLAPNDYLITLSVPDYQKVSADRDLTATAFARHLEGYIHDRGWQTYGDVVVRFEQSPNLHTGQFRARGAVNPDSNSGESAPADEDHAFTAESGVPAMTDNPSYRGGQGQGRPADEYYDERYGRQPDDQRGPEQRGQEQRGPEQREPEQRGTERSEQRGQYPQEQGGYPQQGEPDYPQRGGYPDQGGYHNQGYPPPQYEQRPPAGYGPPGGYDQGYRQGPGGYGPPPGYGPDYNYGRQPGPGRYEDAGYGRQDPRYPDRGYPDRGYPEQQQGGGYGRPDYGRPDYGHQDYTRYGEPPAGYPDQGYAEPGRDYDYGQQAGGDYGQPPAGDYAPQAGPQGGYGDYGQGDYPAGAANVTLQLDDGSGRTYQLREGANVIGRGQDAQFRLPDTGVSRRHLEIRWDGQVALLSDLNSTNGTTVNNAPVQEWQLADGDVIRLGHSEIIVRVH